MSAKIVTESKRFQFNHNDLLAWLKQTKKVWVPYLLALIPVVIQQVPAEWTYAVITVWVLNRIYSFLTLWYAGAK